jgi:LAO/AO transport system kinase
MSGRDIGAAHTARRQDNLSVSNPTLADRVLAGDSRAIARAITLIEDESPAGAEIVRRVFAKTGGAYLIGVTGPPGAGKSTLVDKLTVAIRATGRTVGIVAVDPTSPFTGGAILGDRVRMQTHAGDAGVFIRSMATRGHLGGLAQATSEVALVFDAAGKDVVLIETVGVGQDEVDIVRTADISIVMVVPGSGDEVQALKAGIMEIADIFVVNKADREGADRTVASIEAVLSLQTFAPGEWRPPILKTEATSGKGVPGLLDEIDRFRAQSPQSQGTRRRARAEWRLREQLAQRFVQHVERRVLRAGELEQVLDRIAAREVDPYSAVDSIFSRAVVEPGEPPEPTEPAVSIDHIGIAVSNLDEALAFYRDALGLEIDAPEEVASQRVRAHFIPAGDAALELLEATAADSPIAKYVAKRGPGLHHITLRVADIRAMLAQLKAKGVRLIDEAPREGAHRSQVAFVHPASAHGVLVELKEAGGRTQGAGDRGSGIRKNPGPHTRSSS